MATASPAVSTQSCVQGTPTQIPRRLASIARRTDATADSVSRFKDDHVDSMALEHRRRTQARNAGADDDDALLVLVLPRRQWLWRWRDSRAALEGAAQHLHQARATITRFLSIGRNDGGVGKALRHLELAGGHLCVSWW